MNLLRPFLLSLAAISFALGLRAATSAPGADPAALHLAFPDAWLVVSGLPWFGEEQPVLRRLPSRLKSTFPPKVWGLADE